MNVDTSIQFITKVYRYMKNGQDIDSFMKEMNISFEELNGIIELCNLYGKRIELVPSGNSFVFSKKPLKKYVTNKQDIDDAKLIHNEICVVSDTHFGNNRQQLHLLNDIYQEAYDRDIDTVLHCGDMVDGNYPNRPENPRLQFLHGFDEQAGYVVEMYPYVKGINTYYILGSHDETHYKNGQATVNKWVSKCRGDMHYLGQDSGEYNLDGVKIVMDHPGGGSAQSVSYKPQKRIEILESGEKPKLLLIGHYHKSYYFVYRNVRGILVPALCDKTQFQSKQGLSNAVGGYFLDIYSDDKGNIVYFEPEEILYSHKDMWDEAGKDKRKIKQLVIK